MDLPTCPSCGQSVIDDEAEECPFCGESMTGKPVVKKPKPAPKATAKAGSKSHVPADGQTWFAKVKGEDYGPVDLAFLKKWVREGRLVEESQLRDTDSQDWFRADQLAGLFDVVQAVDDSPFDSEPDDAIDAIAASPKRTKGRSQKIVCPMCETVGYVPKKAAGKSVKCANAECLVPVFTAPELETEAADAKPTAKPVNKKALIYGALVGVGLIGAGVAWFLAGQKPEQHGPIPQKTYKMVEDPNTIKTKTETAKTEKVVQESPFKKLREQALFEMDDLSFTPETEENRSIAACRRLVADAFTRSDDFGNSAKQLALLQAQLKPSTEYFKIPLHVSAARRKAAANDDSAARAELAAALRYADSLPKIGQDRLDVVTDLAVALVMMGQTAQARKLVEAHEDGSMDAQLSSFAQIARELEYSDLKLKRWARPLFRWFGPLHKAVAVALVARGANGQVAREWAENCESVATKVECILGHVETRMLVSGAVPDSEVDSLMAKLPPEGQALLQARIAFRSWGQVATVQAHIAKAIAALNRVQPLQSLQRTDNARLIVDAKIPDPTSIEIATRAGVEVARLQFFLNQREAAWTTFETVLKLSASMAPPSSVAFALRQVPNTAKADLEAFVKDALQLTADQEVQAMANRYLAQCRLIADSSHRRYLLQGHVLLHAAILVSRETVGFQKDVMGVLEQDRYLLTAIPIAWARVFEQVQRKDFADHIERDLNVPPRAMTDYEEVELGARGSSRMQLDKAKELLEKGRPEIEYLRRIWLHDIVLGLCNESDLQGQPVAWRDAFSLIKATAARRSADDLWREQAFNLLSIRATRFGQGANLFQYLTGQKLPATQGVAALHGLVVGCIIVERRLPVVAPENQEPELKTTAESPASNRTSPAGSE